ncbi:hypothetical protein ATCVOR07043_557L [Acanthocystis turfacea Chlorella virus OR0704.3]|nr:hypothetical protein ATCVOR07043_557L [Acanthocystis turfacea Chlorella virus OR0704.3]
MYAVHIIVAVLVILLASTIYMWFTKPSAVRFVPVDTRSTCDCSNQIEESYDLGYADGFNLTTIAEDEDDTMETFYDYEYDKKGKKTEAKTGGSVVKAVGGLCPNKTQPITSGNNKGKCQRTGDWYKTYRGTNEKGKAFTCTGGRVSNGKACVCDESSGKKWNGSKCMCTSGFSWDKKSKQCIKKGQFNDLLKNMKPKAGPAPKPSPAKKPASSSTGFHKPSNAGKPSSTPLKKPITSFSDIRKPSNAGKPSSTPLKKPITSFSDIRKPSNAGKPSSTPLKKPITSFNGARKPSNFK